ncbi:MAG: hypothetical protein DMF73_12605 [Acidobacteria bacterium]|nr:MAG: hypothetical protein DMF73_12605 [Acidobacteriota bacterium]
MSRGPTRADANPVPLSESDAAPILHGDRLCSGNDYCITRHQYQTRVISLCLGQTIEIFIPGWRNQHNHQRAD